MLTRMFPQIDDLFLATEEPFVTTNSYRMTPADSVALAQFQANVPQLPAGSSFRVLFRTALPRSLCERINSADAYLRDVLAPVNCPATTCNAHRCLLLLGCCKCTQHTGSAAPLCADERAAAQCLPPVWHAPDAAPLTDLLAAQIEMVYNNGGYIAQTQNEQYFNLWSDTEPADTLQTFQKPPGEYL